MVEDEKIYKTMYIELFGAVNDVIEELKNAEESGEKNEIIFKAKEMLMNAEAEAEELYINQP